MIPYTYEIIKRDLHEIKKKGIFDETLRLQLYCLRFEIKRVEVAFAVNSANKFKEESFLYHLIMNQPVILSILFFFVLYP